MAIRLCALMAQQIMWILACLLMGAPLHAACLGKKEQAELTDLFQRLITTEWGYTLFGEKPLSFYSYCVKLPPGFLIEAPFLDPKLEKLYLLYDKYKEYFLSERYIILDQPCLSHQFPTSGITRDLLILNKHAFTHTVTEHLALFQERLGMPISPESLLAEIASGKNVLFEVLQEDELLWGILLGYGVHNAQLYARREQLQKSQCLLPTLGYASLAEEQAAIEKCLSGFSQDYYLQQIPLPLFLCDQSHPETQALQAEYRKTQQVLLKVYRSAHRLDCILNHIGAPEGNPSDVKERGA